MLSYVVDFLEAPNDIEPAVEARMELQRVIYTGDRRFVVVSRSSPCEHRWARWTPWPANWTGFLGHVAATGEPRIACDLRKQPPAAIQRTVERRSRYPVTCGPLAQRQSC